MKTFAACYLLIGLVTASALRSVQYGGIHGLLNRRSQELHVSPDTEAYMNDVSLQKAKCRQAGAEEPRL